MIRHICFALVGASMIGACGSQSIPTVQLGAAQTVTVTLADWSVQAIPVRGMYTVLTVE